MKYLVILLCYIALYFITYIACSILGSVIPGQSLESITIWAGTFAIAGLCMIGAVKIGNHISIKNEKENN